MKSPPLFSIIIPTYNRPGHLSDCLQSLSQLNYPRDRFEVIVVDDGSASPLDEVVEPFNEALCINLTRQSNAGPAAARNAGARHARGKYLAFTDDDCCPEPHWLQKLEARLADSPDCIIGGQTVNMLSDNPFSTMSQNIISIGYDHYNSVRDQARFFTSNNMVVPTQAFLEVGGFNTDFRTSEDRELCDRWIHSGRRMLYDPDIVIYHAHPMTLQQFWRQHFTYGQGAFRFHNTRSKKGWGNFKIEGNYYVNLLLYPFRHGQSRQGASLTFALLVSQVANLSGFLWEMKQGSGEKDVSSSTPA
ncbi:MAG: glycosyltransferase [Elainellaceae cyanobacterium]